MSIKARLKILDARDWRPRFMSWLQDQRHRLRALNVEHLAALGNCNAVQRLSWLLLRLARRTANGSAGISADFAFPLTQTDLADYLSMTAIHLNRTVRKLREANVAHLRNGHIMIPDLQRLERQCVIIGPASSRMSHDVACSASERERRF
jgi:CRP-like cAMP-binding protein